MSCKKLIMADEKISMRLNIEGKPYPMSAPAEKEEIYRRAASEINAYANSLRAKLQGKLEERDYLALAALKFAIDKIDLQRSREVGDEDMKALKEIDSRLDSYLNAPDKNE